MPVALGYANRSDAATLSGGSFDATHTRARMQDQRMRYAARTANCKRSSTWFRGVFTANYTVRALAIGYHNCTRYGRMRVRAGRSPFDLIFDSEDTGGILDERLTKSGGNNGTRVNKSGYIVPVTRTNLLVRSAEFDNGSWVKTNCTVTADSIETLETTTTSADKLDEASASGSHGVSQTFSATSGVTYCLSVYVKQGTKRYVQLSYATASHGANAYANFDLTDGTVGEVGSAVLRANITPEGKGWWRIVMVAPATATTAAATADLWLVNSSVATRAVSYTGANQYIYAWGAQMEEGGDATTYIPTTSATASATESGRINYGTFRTNLLKWSERLERSSAWTRVALDPSPSEATDPNGGDTADGLYDTTANSQHYIEQSVTPTASTTYTYSGYVKAGTRSYVGIRVVFSGGANDCQYRLDLSAISATQTASGSMSPSCTLTSVGSGWYRFALTFTTPATLPSSSLLVRLHGSTAAALTYAGDGTLIFYAWGAQLEYASSATAYIATTYSARTVVDSCNGLLVEEARTNLLTYSQAFDNAAWTKDNSSATAGVLAPDGTASGCTLTPTTVGTLVRTARQSYTTATNGTYTISVYAKVGTLTSNGVALRIRDNANTHGVVANFNLFTLATPTVTVAGGSWTGVAHTPASVGNGWVRLALSVTTNTVHTSLSNEFYLSSFTSVAETTGTIHLWGAQLEAGAFATSYIPTTSASVTRTLDSISVTGSNFSGFFNAPEGTLYAAGSPQASNSSSWTLVEVSTDINNRIGLFKLTSTGNGSMAALDGGGTVVSTAHAAWAATGKFAGAYRANDYAATLDGAAVVTDTAATVPACVQMTLGRRADGAAVLNGHLSRVTYWPERLKNSELISITTSGPDAIGYNSGWVDALQFEFNSDYASTWGTKYNLLAYMSSAVTAGYFTVEIDDQYITDSYLMLGRLSVMTALAPTEDANIAGWRESREELSTVSRSESGRLFANERPRPRNLDFALPALTQTEADHVHEIQDLCGITDEILLIPDTADMAYSQRYGGIGFLRELTALEYFNDANDRRSTAFRWQEKL